MLLEITDVFFKHDKKHFDSRTLDNEALTGFALYDIKRMNWLYEVEESGWKESTYRHMVLPM